MAVFPSEISEDFFALLSELWAEAAVDQDVGGRVDGKQEVADGDHDAGPQGEALKAVRLAFHCVAESGPDWQIITVKGTSFDIGIFK